MVSTGPRQDGSPCFLAHTDREKQQMVSQDGPGQKLMEVGIAAGSLQNPGKSWNPKEQRLPVRARLSWRDLTAPPQRSQGNLVPRPQASALGSARPLPALQVSLLPEWVPLCQVRGKARLFVCLH